MMKMMPDASGTEVDFTIDGTYTFSQTVDMSTTFVEEIHDLDVVVFVQNLETGEVFQSAFMEQEMMVVIIPGDEDEDVALDSDIELFFNNEMRNIDDSEITNDNISDIITLSSPDKANLSFTATINDSKQIITINPDNDFDFDTEITVSLTSVENINDEALADTSITFTSMYMYPTVEYTPADEETDVDVTSTISLQFNKPMRNIDDSEITDANISDIISIVDYGSGPVFFTATINASKDLIVLTPNSDFDFNTDINVSIDDIEDINEVVLDGSDVTFTTETGIKIDEDNISNINIYPNPAVSNIVIECDINSRINIFDTNGKLILTHLTTNKVNNIDLNSISTGIYYVNISNSKYNETEKLIIIK